MDASMINGKPTTFAGDERYKCLDVEHWPIHWLDEPTNWQAARHKKGNVRYQVCYSVQVLEQMLAEEGQWHVLQMSFEIRNGSEQMPDYWYLYADGYQVAKGTGEFALSCFQEAPTRFLEVCRSAIEAAKLPPLTEQGFNLLCRARAITQIKDIDWRDKDK